MFHSLGKRTLRLIRHIGVAEIETSRSEKRFTSETIDFHLPNYDVEYALFFSIKKDRVLPFAWEQVSGITACLDVKGSDSPVAIASYAVDRETYINGISMPANARWLGMNAMPKYEEKVAGLTNLLEVGEALKAGQPVDTLLDRLPFDTPNEGNAMQILPGDGQPHWPVLPISPALDVDI